jgi:hypothetical protein
VIKAHWVETNLAAAELNILNLSNLFEKKYVKDCFTALATVQAVSVIKSILDFPADLIFKKRVKSITKQ